ncbi:MAG TPA: hypothetical protein VMD28_09060 [Acidimicrobiales bacterium]|nr:hypothetical protein [Acidimicrobiales bacterium]
MGIGPFQWDRRRARLGGIALGVVAAAVVASGGGPPLAYAVGPGAPPASRGVRAVTRTEGHRTPASHTTATAAVRTGAADARREVPSVILHASVVGVASDKTGGGYWEVAANGDLFAAGDAAFHGSIAQRPLAAHVVGLVADPASGGYWEVAANGDVFSFGAPNYGSIGRHRLAAPIVGMASTPNGKGYWEVAADGGIFSFGDARFSGSLGARRMKPAIVGMAADPAGGYWEVARTGGVFGFGAPDFGSLAGKKLRSPIAGLAATPRGRGYWEVAADGVIYGFGGARFAGAAKVTLPASPGVAPSNPPSTPTANADAPAVPAASLSRPSENVPPLPAYTFEAGGNYSSTTSLPCWTVGASAWIPELDSQCVAAEVAATDNARGDEGLPPMSLPSDYASLTPEEQLFVLADIERVSRGEQPAVGLSPLLDTYAEAGADTGDDPQFSFSAIASSDWWGSNVVSGALNALDANYTWMYEDGYGGYNVDCTSPTSVGCWGHRANVLTSDFEGTLVMGAADVEQRTKLQCLSELFVGVQDPSDLPPLSYTWAEAVAAGAAG